MRFLKELIKFYTGSTSYPSTSLLTTNPTSSNSLTCVPTQHRVAIADTSFGDDDGFSHSLEYDKVERQKTPKVRNFFLDNNL